MLKTISPLISPELLKVLAEMGHGDEIIFSDAHFPAHSMGPQVIRADGLLVSDTPASDSRPAAEPYQPDHGSSL